MLSCLVDGARLSAEGEEKKWKKEERSGGERLAATVILSPHTRLEDLAGLARTPPRQSQGGEAVVAIVACRSPSQSVKE